MADSIERTIFKLELDGSAYIQGADKLSESTKKLSDAQQTANQRLKELQAQQKEYKKSLEEVDAILKLNAKDTVDLTRDLNLLKDAGKGTSAEATKLKTVLRETALSTKELRAEAAQLKSNLTTVSKEIKDADKATGGFSAGLGKVYTGLAKVANIIPGLGIGTLVGIIAGPLVAAFTSWIESMDQVNERQKILGESFRSGDYQEAIKNVDLLTLNVKLAKEGFLDKSEVLKEYNETLGKSLGHVNSLDEAETNLVKKGPAYIQMTLLKAAANIALDRAAKLAVDAAIDLQKSQDNLTKINRKGEAEADKSTGAAGLSEFVASGVKNEAAKAKRVADEGVKSLKTIAENFQKDAAQIAKDFDINFEGTGKDIAGLAGSKIKAEKTRKQITNIYEQELQKLKADIAKLDEKGFSDEATITKAIEEDFRKRALAFDKAFKNKQLTKSQLNSLGQYLESLQKLTIEQNLKSFREQKAAYLAQIQSELDSLQIEENTKRISAIQDRFERERQLIISEAEKTATSLSAKRDKLISDISKNAAKNGLTQADIAPQLLEITSTYERLLDDLLVIKNQKLQQLSFETFERLSEDAKRLLDARNLGLSEATLTGIKEQAKLLAEGKISYEEYQKAITDIARAEANERFQIEKNFLTQEIRIREQKLLSDKTLTDDQVKRLQDEIRRLEQQLTDAERGNVTSEGKAKDPKKDPRTAKIVEYANAIGSVVESVVSFWQKANEAESKALDRSIALQEKRVEAAQRIAARGNAQYLKAEEDRLRELTVARENAARRELAINAALQGSQLLVGITGAISKLASGPLGAAQVIGEIGVIFAALATGYGLVKSLQGNQPRLFKGTKYLKRNGEPAGRDTIPAMLNEGESVIPTDTNKEYHPSVSAIYDRSIPAADMNAFVKNYHKPVTLPNYGRIKEAAELHIGQDGKMAVLLSENNRKLDEHIDLQRQTLRAMKNMAVSAHIDKNGVAIMVNEYMQQLKIDKHV